MITISDLEIEAVLAPVSGSVPVLKRLFSNRVPGW